MSDALPLFFVAPPGLEPALEAEAKALGFAGVRALRGGVEALGDWPEIWRANLELRGAARVLARVAGFRAMHLAQLDKRARKVDWAGLFHPDQAVKVEATCRKSRIYHNKAAAERIAGAIEAVGAVISPEAEIVVKARIDDDFCTISLDTTGEALHKRGHKPEVNKAPMRENLAAMFLRDCGFDGREPVFDPMCGSGTLVIEAAEIALGLQPGRSRGFAFEALASFDAQAFSALKRPLPELPPGLRFYGSDRDAGAVRMSASNAERAGVAALTTFQTSAISEVEPPEGPPGLVLVNPPYGARIGNRKLLFGLYAAFGKVMMERFQGWRVGLVTSDGGLAKATGLPWEPSGPPVAHGSLKVTLWRTGPLA